MQTVPARRAREEREERRAAEREESERAAVRLERPADVSSVLAWAAAVEAVPHRISDAAAVEMRAGARAVLDVVTSGGVQWSDAEREDVRAAVARAAVHVAGSITDQTPEDDARELACWALWSVVGAVSAR